MLTGKTQHSNDLMALLMGNGTGKAAGGLEGELLSKEFSSILSHQGAMEGVKGEEILNFFKQMKGQDQMTGDLFKLLESPEGKELLQEFSFDGKSFLTKEGEALSPEALLGKLQNLKGHEENSLIAKDEFFGPKENVKAVNISKKDLKSAQDFLAQRKALQGKGHVEMVDGQPALKTTPQLNTYKKESKLFKSQFIEAKSDGPKVKSSEVFKSSEIVDGGAGIDGDQNLIGLESKFSKTSDGNQMSSESGQIKTLDLSNINSANKTELMNKIGGYIEQSYIAGQDNIELNVYHEELGQFRVHAQKAGPGNMVNLEISTLTEQGQQFFVENESEMIRSLAKNGIKLSDVKIVPSSDIMLAGEGRSSTSDFSQSQGKGESGQFNQFSRQQGQQGSGEERRRQLWRNAQEYQQYLSA